jgi:type II secretory pathway pseudopilin PulG
MISRRVVGFSLVELTIVMLIVVLLLGGLLPTLSSQVEQRQANETRKQLDDIQQALIGYAVINGRLPCPATSTPTNSYGAENFAAGGDTTNGNCSNFNDGFVPAATLGLTQVDSQGFAVDAWNNRIRYAVTSSSAYAFTTTSGMKNNFSTLLTPTSLLVCSNSTASGFNASSCGTNNALTSSPPGVPVVILSTGKNGGRGSAGTDEAANLDGNKTFVSHTPTPSGSANGEFDDIVVWISPNILINRMVAAGQLP